MPTAVGENIKTDRRLIKKRSFQQLSIYPDEDEILLPGSPHAPMETVDAAAGQEEHGDDTETRKPRRRQRRASVQQWASARQSFGASPKGAGEDMPTEARPLQRSRSQSQPW